MWQSNFIESNSIRLHYTRDAANAGKPAFILLHGFSDDGLCWLPIADVLAVSHDVIMLDARGHGRSEGPPSGYGHDQHAADVAGFIAALGLRKPLVMGHSMGAVTTLTLAGLYPDLPGAIVLEDPPPFWGQSENGLQTERRKGMANWIIELKRKTREEMIEDNRAFSPNWPEAERGPWADAKLRLSLHVLSGFGEVGLILRSAVQHIACPALLLTSDVSLGGIATPEGANDLQQLVPQLQVAHIANAGHNIRRDQPVQFLKTVTSFVNSH
jgi:pimeloyl-ACP methyl ester carboxylesterase